MCYFFFVVNSPETYFCQKSERQQSETTKQQSVLHLNHNRNTESQSSQCKTPEVRNTDLTVCVCRGVCVCVSLHHTHGAARGVDCPGHGVLAVVHNVCLHYTLQGNRETEHTYRRGLMANCTMWECRKLFVNTDLKSLESKQSKNVFESHVFLMIDSSQVSL